MLIFILVIFGLFTLFYIAEYYRTPRDRRRDLYESAYDDRYYRRRDRFRYHDPYDNDYYPRERYPYRDDRHDYRGRYHYGRDRGGGGAIMMLLAIAGLGYLSYNMFGNGKAVVKNEPRVEQPRKYDTVEHSNDSKPTYENQISEYNQETIERPSTVNSKNKNVAPSNKKQAQSQIAKESLNDDSVGRLSNQDAIYYAQLSTAQTLEKAIQRAEELEQDYPGQIFIVKDTEALNLPFKIVCGAFPTKYAAKAAVGDSGAFVRSELEEKLRFIE